MSPFATSETDEEALVKAPPLATIPEDADYATFRRNTKSPLRSTFLLAVVVVCVASVSTYNTMLNRLSIRRGRSSSGEKLALLSADELELHARWLANDFRESHAFAEPLAGGSGERRRSDLDERMTEVVKDAWPTCVNLKMTGIQCKKYINKLLLAHFTGQDRVVQKNSTDNQGTEITAGYQSGITITITTETYTGAPNADTEDPASGPQTPKTRQKGVLARPPTPRKKLLAKPISGV